MGGWLGGVGMFPFSNVVGRTEGVKALWNQTVEVRANTKCTSNEGHEKAWNVLLLKKSLSSLAGQEGLCFFELDT